jgi:Histidine kinase-, DNA gyrase B-, and HSP90-like ATPase
VALSADLKHDTIEITVRDTGVGIENAKLKEIFTPFVKVQKNREFNKEGVGLGLAVSRSIARALGGDIKVQSTEGIGSIFTLVLPMREANEELYTLESVSGNDTEELKTDESVQCEVGVVSVASLTKQQMAMIAADFPLKQQKTF